MVQTTSYGATAYATVAASQTAQRITYNPGTYLTRLIIQPATVGCGVVTLYDGAGTGAVTVFTFPGGGTSALVDLKPFVVEVGACSTGVGDTTGWHITTGANISVVAVCQVR